MLAFLRGLGRVSPDAIGICDQTTSLALIGRTQPVAAGRSGANPTIASEVQQPYSCSRRQRVLVFRWHCETGVGEAAAICSPGIGS